MEKFNELYYQKPYVREFSASVISCEKEADKYLVELSSTAFYPEGGGQPGDRGILKTDDGREIAVSDTRKQGERVVHIVSEPLKLGGNIRGIIDWERRMYYTRNHTGEHIVSGILKEWYGYENVGFHMNDTCVTFDCSGPLDEDQLREVESYANEIIRRDIEVLEIFPNEEERAGMDYRSKLDLEGIVRIVNIPGADTCACCGTHVARTGEIGLIKFLTASNRKKGCRIELVCGRRAYEVFQEQMDQVKGISRILSVKVNEAESGVEKLNADFQALKYDIHLANIKYLDCLIAGIKDEHDLLIHFEDKLDIDDMRYFGNKIVDGEKANVCAILSKDGSKYNYVIRSNKEDLRTFAKDLNTGLNGRGGGNATMIQGSFEADEKAIREGLEKIINKKACLL